MSKKSKPPGQQPGGFLAPYGLELDEKILDLALTHRSWAYEQGESPAPHNERLEFLGDAVLGLATTAKLFREFADLPEGELSRRRAAIVSSHSLAMIARSMGLGEHIKLGRGEERSGGADKESILADALEALIGAVFVEHGPERAELFVHQVTAEQFSQIDSLVLFFDPKTTLQEEADARKIARPEYLIEASGPNHDRVYKATVAFIGVMGEGSASNKKAAELLAAKQVVNRLNLTGQLITQKEGLNA